MEPSFGAQMGMQAAQDVQGAILGLALQGHNNKVQLKQQGKLSEQQLKFDIEKMEEQNRLGLKMWEDTNYSAQVAQMKKAGLGVGLMYGGSGQGGTTANSGGGNVSAPSAPSGGGEIMGMQLLQAQRSLIEAQTENVKANTAKTSGVDTELTKQQGRIAENAADFAKNTYDVNYTMLLDAAEKLSNEAEIMRANKDVKNETKHIEIQSKESELVGLGIANELKRKQIDLTEEQIKATAESVAQKWREVNIKQGHLDLDKFIKDVKESTKLTTDTILKVISIIK